ncbi:unnamed protein product, partial [Ostreobium quekettii]
CCAVNPGVGFCTEEVNLCRLPGWDRQSYGYHGDDGHAFPGRGQGRDYGPTFTAGDVIGAILNRAEKTISYTKNGIHLGVAFNGVSEERLFPTVGFRTKEEEIKVNFGETEFVADFQSMWSEQCERVLSSIEKVPVPSPSGLGPSGCVAEIILDYLIHHRYWQTAALVARDLMGDSREVGEDEQRKIIARQKIYDAVVNGNIDEALSQTDSIAPGTLETHPQILFKLRCQKFMEMLQGGEDETHAALQFGRTILTPSCSKKDDQAFLSEVLTLIAYEDPNQSPFGHLLKPEYRRELADELNSAILTQQGRSKRSSLETVHNQMMASFEELRSLGDMRCRLVDVRGQLLDGLPENNNV